LTQEEAQIDNRLAIFDGQAYDTPVLWRDNLPAGTTLHSPVIIEERSATTVVPPGYRVLVDELGGLIISQE
jgi:N-methylhydantoinase A